jgi:hypothetical protein
MNYFRNFSLHPMNLPLYFRLRNRHNVFDYEKNNLTEYSRGFDYGGNDNEQVGSYRGSGGQD